jgi:hypothetical protein
MLLINAVIGRCLLSGEGVRPLPHLGPGGRSQALGHEAGQIFLLRTVAVIGANADHNDGDTAHSDHDGDDNVGSAISVNSDFDDYDSLRPLCDNVDQRGADHADYYSNVNINYDGGDNVTMMITRILAMLLLTDLTMMVIK